MKLSNNFQPFVVVAEEVEAEVEEQGSRVAEEEMGRDSIVFERAAYIRNKSEDQSLGHQRKDRKREEKREKNGKRS